MSDLEEGHNKEQEFAVLLRGNNPHSEVVASGEYNRGFDVYLKDALRKILFEVKYDRQANKTGNIAIEIWYKWEPSGIITTQADYIVYNFDEQFWVIRTDKLLEYIKWRPTIQWWDWKKSKLVLLKVSECKNIFIPYNKNEQL